MIAAGMNDSTSKSIAVPKEIGSLKFFRKKWTTTSPVEFEEIKTRPCVRSDFNFGDDKTSTSKFYITQKTKSELDSHWPDMKCPVDDKDLSVRGQYSSSNAVQFMIVFEKCDKTKTPEINCKDDTKILEWLAFKYILVLSNEKHFIQHKFGNDRIK